ncbi:MAG: hypothetical protein JWO13_2280 [Acidobacteriales bacterium]|nr:hypothetical protein [Terriglobales bacterium]
MADSVNEQVLAAMAVALNAPLDKPAATYRTRVDAFAASELPAFVLFAGKQNPNRESTHRVNRKLTVRLEAIVAAEAPADKLTDPLYVYAVNTLMAWAAGADMIQSLSEAAIEWQTEAGLSDVCIASIEFDVVFTTTLDPTERINQ